jgi:hypothetical protein
MFFRMASSLLIRSEPAFPRLPAQQFPLARNSLSVGVVARRVDVGGGAAAELPTGAMAQVPAVTAKKAGFRPSCLSSKSLAPALTAAATDERDRFMDVLHIPVSCEPPKAVYLWSRFA